jgi:hypothetical protein
MMLRRTASNARKVVAKMMRNMHVALYWPVVAGVQDIEKRGVVVEVKKVMAILSIPIMDVDVIPVDPSVEVDMGISAIVVVGDIDIDISMFILKGAICAILENGSVKLRIMFANYAIKELCKVPVSGTG